MCNGNPSSTIVLISEVLSLAQVPVTEQKSFFSKKIPPDRVGQGENFSLFVFQRGDHEFIFNSGGNQRFSVLKAAFDNHII